jgi:hypothetical protein
MKETPELYVKLLKDPSLVSELTKMQSFDVLEYAETIKADRSKLWSGIYEADPFSQHIRLMTVKASREGFPHDRILEYLLMNDQQYSQASKVVSIISGNKQDIGGRVHQLVGIADQLPPQVEKVPKSYKSITRVHGIYIFELLEGRKDSINRKESEGREGTTKKIQGLSSKEFPFEKANHHRRVYESWLEVRSRSNRAGFYKKYHADYVFARDLLSKNHPELNILL